LAKPTGPTLIDLLDQRGAEMYSAPLEAASSRVRPEFKPVVFQWVLTFISGLAFVHSHDIIFGNPDLEQCWLDKDLRLSLVGFVNAWFFDHERNWATVKGDWEGIYDDYSAGRDPTKNTDLVLFGYTVYELMTAYPPSMRSGMRPWKKRGNNISRHLWPRLETEYMGDIVRMCCSGGYANADEVKAAVVRFVKESGFEIDEDDNLKGFDAKGHFE
jgi:serine/threonine protein kinase